MFSRYIQNLEEKNNNFEFLRKFKIFESNWAIYPVRRKIFSSTKNLQVIRKNVFIFCGMTNTHIFDSIRKHGKSFGGIPKQSTFEKHVCT